MNDYIIKMSASESKKQLVLRKLSKMGTTWHPESTCVFKAPGTTKKDRVVIGRWVDDEFISLDEDALALCEEWDFKPDESLLADASEEDEQSEGGEAEEEASPDEASPDEDEQEDEEEQEDGKEEQKEEVPEPVPVVPKSKNVSGSTSVKRVEALTGELTKNIMEVVNDLQSQIDSLTVELGNKTKECEELQGKYDAINQKFAAMKSLFN